MPSHHGVTAMDGNRGKAPSVPNSSTQSIQMIKSNDNTTKTPFVFKHGRRYLREPSKNNYPLPCDGPEIHRQNLRTLLAVKAFGRALCSPFVEKSQPKRVLDVGCGGGYWSSLCHDYLVSLGCLNVEFVGIDIAPIAPDLKKQGINWRFVQHDLRKTPLPFEDAHFDIVLVKDMGIAFPMGETQDRIFDDVLRILRPGGTLEIWETDYLVRNLLPHPPAPPRGNKEDHDYAARTATFLISPATPFAKSTNKYLTNSNSWIQDALDRMGTSATSCGRIQPMLLQEPDNLDSIGMRRVAIPFGELKWERQPLTPEQSDLRQAALLNSVMFIASMEPLLREVSGKNAEEWTRWWNWMMADLYAEGGADGGDCIELGAYWARKI